MPSSPGFLYQRVVVFLLLPLLFVGGLELMHRQLPHEFQTRRGLLANNSFEGFILGSSHTYYGLDPTQIESVRLLNMAWPGQGLMMDTKIYDRLLSVYDPSVLVLDGSYHMFPYATPEASQTTTGEAHNIYYFDQFMLHTNTFGIRSCFDRIVQHLRGAVPQRMNALGFGRRKSTIEVEGKAQADAYRHNQYWSDGEQLRINLDHLQTLVDGMDNSPIVLYLPPLHPLYLDNLEATHLTQYRSILQFLQSEYDLHVIDFTSELNEELHFFQDGDHLTTEGAEYISQRFDSTLNSYLSTLPQID